MSYTDLKKLKKGLKEAVAEKRRDSNFALPEHTELRSVVGLDQGTTSTRAIRFDETGKVCGVSQRPLKQTNPEAGWVEHDPLVIWQDSVACLREIMCDSVVGIGISNQRETVIAWDRGTGMPIYNAIGWQDRRTADHCEVLRERGLESMIREKTGLLLDPFFSATKLTWILDNVEGARQLAESEMLAFGTIDCWLVWQLTAGQAHVTDVTNASRTMLFNIHTLDWDEELLDLFDIPRNILPKIVDNDSVYGTCRPDLFKLPQPMTVGGMAGDQQCAAIGQACFSQGDFKVSLGTGCFLLANVGFTVPKLAADQKLITTVAWRLNGQTSYALEGSMLVAGAAVSWLRDKLGIIKTPEETWAIADGVPDDHGVYVVPGFVGLGAPYWRRGVSGMVTGLTLNSGAAHLVRATLESIAFQIYDLVEALLAAFDQVTVPVLRVVGGMAANDWFVQCLADILNIPVERPAHFESAARGAAYLAGLATGLWSDKDAIRKIRDSTSTFYPKMEEGLRARMLKGWKFAIQQALLTMDPTPNIPSSTPAPAVVAPAAVTPAIVTVNDKQATDEEEPSPATCAPTLQTPCANRAD